MTRPAVADSESTSTAPALLSVVPAGVQPCCTFNGQGVQFDYPYDWKKTQGCTAVLCIASQIKGESASLSLDVPKLPWHIPGMISVGMVASGYVDDLRKSQLHDAVVKEKSSITVGGEKARRIICTGHVDGKASTDVAVIIVHADRVYIFSADSDEPGFDHARKALDRVVETLKWK